jgi:hypothetical protein
LNTKNTQRGTPIRAAAQFSARSTHKSGTPAIGCECQMSDCCYVLSASPICFFRISSPCREPFPD